MMAVVAAAPGKNQGIFDNGQGNGQGNGHGNGNGNGNGFGKPCGVNLRPDNNPGADNRSKRARANFQDLPSSCDATDELKIELPNGKIKTLAKVRSTMAGLGRPDSLAYWYGQDASGNTMNYVRSKSGKVFGSYVDLGTAEVHQFRVDENGEQIVKTTATRDFPPEAKPLENVEEDEGPAYYNNTRALALSRGTAYGDGVLRGMVKRQVSGEQQTRRLGDDNGGNFDLVVVWTKKAECKNAGLSNCQSLSSSSSEAMRALIELAVAETNTAYLNSGVHTQLNLVWMYRDSSYVETSSQAFDNALTALRSSSDGKLDKVHTYRNQYGADLVAMIIDDSQYCGLGYIGPRSDLMFSVTAWNCATGYYSFGHEIG